MRIDGGGRFIFFRALPLAAARPPRAFANNDIGGSKLENSPICAIADLAAKCFETERSPMPRQSQASLTVAAFSPGPRRLEPPAEFVEGSIERAIFLETAASVASEELAAAAVVGDRPSPWLEVYKTPPDRCWR